MPPASLISSAAIFAPFTMLSPAGLFRPPNTPILIGPLSLPSLPPPPPHAASNPVNSIPAETTAARRIRPDKIRTITNTTLCVSRHTLNERSPSVVARQRTCQRFDETHEKCPRNTLRASRRNARVTVSIVRHRGDVQTLLTRNCHSSGCNL